MSEVEKGVVGTSNHFSSECGITVQTTELTSETTRRTVELDKTESTLPCGVSRMCRRVGNSVTTRETQPGLRATICMHIHAPSEWPSNTTGRLGCLINKFILNINFYLRERESRVLSLWSKCCARVSADRESLAVCPGYHAAYTAAAGQSRARECKKSV